MSIRKINPLLNAFLSFSAFIHSVWLGVLFFKECVSKTLNFVCSPLFSLVKKSKGLVSGSCHKYAGFFLEWYLYVKNAIISQPILMVPISITGYYIYYYIAWAWQVGWWLAFVIVRARFLACLNHTVRLIENTVIGKLFFFGSLGFLSHHLGWVDLSPAHLEAVLTEIFHIRNYVPPVLPLEPYACHEIIQSADTKVAMKSLSEIVKENESDVVYFRNHWTYPGEIFIDKTTKQDVALNGFPCSPIIKAARSITFEPGPRPGKIFWSTVQYM